MRKPSKTTIEAELLSKAALRELLGDTVGDSTLWGWMKDQEFPLPIELGKAGGRNSASAWWRQEVMAWLKSRPRRAIGKGAHQYKGRRDEVTGKPSPKPRGKPRKQLQRAADASFSAPTA